jgi:membrane protein
MNDIAADARAPADSPDDIPAAGWKQVLIRTYKESDRDHVSIIAAGVAFYAFLAFVPLLGALVLVYGLVAEPSSVVQHIRAMTAVMPADAAKIIGEQLLTVSQAAAGKKGLGLLIALLLSIYGAMRGSSAIITALNVVYNVDETRGFVRTTLVAVALTLGAVFALLTAILGISVLASIEHLLPSSAPALHAVLKILFWIAAAAVISLLIALIYRHAPDRPKAKWQWLSPGAIVATLLWVAATLGFGFYVANVGNYNATYGSLGAIVVFLTWLYLTAYILLMGGELNAELEKQTTCPTAEA